MRQILEEKTFEEIKYLEQKAQDIKHNRDDDFIAILKEDDKTKNRKLEVIEKHPGAVKALEDKFSCSQNNIQSIPSLGQGGKTQYLRTSSPSDGSQLHQIRKYLGDQTKNMIKEGTEENSFKNTSYETSKLYVNLAFTFLDV
jgi:hypothetical protein